MRFDYNNQQGNHKKEINYMHHCFMGMKAKNEKVIKDVEVGQVCLQSKLLTMEENHAKEVIAMKVEHSSQMDAIAIQLQKFQHRLEDERKKEMSTDQKHPYLLQQAPSYYEEVICSIEKWLIEGDPDKMEINKNQMQNEERHVMHILHISFESFEAECSTSLVLQLATKKKRKRKIMKKWFDASDGREQLDFRIGKSPTVCKIGHGTSEKQPIDLPESRKMLNMHYIERI